MRPIDADALMKRYGLQNAVKYGNKTGEEQAFSYDTLMMYEIADMIEYEPTLDCAPVKRGHWEKEEDFIGEKYRCTMCKKVIRYDRAYVCQGELIFDFCPFCGADMRGDDK